MRLRRRPMLPVTLLLISASVAVPAGLFGFLAWESRQEAIASAYGRVEQTTGILHEHAQKVFELNAAALERAAQHVARTGGGSGPGDPAQLRDFLRQVERSSPTVQSLWVFAADGSVVATSLPEPIPSGLTVRDRDYFRHHRERPGAAYFVSAPLTGRGDGRQQFALTRRLEDSSGAFAGVVISGIASDYFSRQWQGLSPELDPGAALVRHDGVVLVRHPSLPVEAPPLLPGSEYMQAVLGEPAATRQMASSIDGSNRIVSYRRLEGYPVSIAYAVSLDAVLAGWRHAVAFYALACGTAALALLGMAGLAHRRSRVEQDLIAQLRHTEAARTRFFADVSHELRTPLALILGPVGRLLRGSPVQGEERRELEVIARNAQALLGRVNDLMDVGRIDAPTTPLEYARTDLAQLVRLVCSCFQPAARDSAITLEIDTPPELLADVDAAKVERIVFELLSNALRFTPAAGRIRVLLAVEDEQACLVVRDTGPGVPPQLREAVFDRFRGARDPPGRTGSGTGLGLPIVREFARLHGGTVALEDAPPGGALVRLRLPLHAPPGATVLVHPPAPGAAPMQTASGGAAAEASLPRVLVVEDHPDMNAFIVQMLAQRYHVTAAYDGAQGLGEALRDPAPDLIVLDLMLPRMDGEAVLECLRREPRLHDVPVLMLTARADDELQARMLRKGAQDFLQKPFAEDVLLERVGRLLADRARAAALLRRSERRLRSIVQTARNAIIVTDSERRIVLFNSAAERMFGYAAASVLGQTIDLLVSRECWDRCASLEGAAAEAQTANCGAHQARRADGSQFPFECSMSRLDEDGACYYTVILRDITARVLDRKALVDAHEELQRVTQGFHRELIAAVEARQARIARDLHDSVGASLAGVSLLIGSVRPLVAPSPALAALDKAQEQVAATAEAVRGISRGLMPAGTDSGGLLHALDQFAADLTGTSSVVCSLHARGSFTGFDAETATHVFRIVQEAASNAIRHGRATAVRILLSELDGRWRVSVWDNGTGCDFGLLSRAHPGLGLRSMQARARAIGGELQLTTNPHGGCRVRVTWSAPCSANA